MPELKGTKTEQNLKDAFAGESQARNKYTYFASVARKEGYEKIAGFFQETADNEKEHAKLHLQYLGGIGTTADNLSAAAEGERDEFTDMYPRMAREAMEEGFPKIAFIMESLGKIEKAHQVRYQRLLEELKAGTLFVKDDAVLWRCMNCGHNLTDAAAPMVCPVCKCPQSYFELVEDHYAETWKILTYHLSS